jgi:hypothetical protein
MFRFGRWWQQQNQGSGPWQPTIVPELFDDFDTAVSEDHLGEGCRRLGVEPTGDIYNGYSRRSIGTVALARDGSRSWVKLSALRGRATHWLRDGELSVEQCHGVPRPRLLASRQWSDGNRHFAAIQCTLAACPAIEPTLWAGANASEVSDAWIASLTDALSSLAKIETKRMRYQPQQIERMIRDCFGSRAPCVAEEWCVAHGDLQWSNLTSPNLTLLDWECWGHAPRGYDAAYLIAASCADPELVRRLERVFADDLETESGRVARLAAIANLMSLIKAGWLDPRYRRHLRAMGRRVLSA